MCIYSLKYDIVHDGGNTNISRHLCTVLAIHVELEWCHIQSKSIILPLGWSNQSASVASIMWFFDMSVWLCIYWCNSSKSIY